MTTKTIIACCVLIMTVASAQPPVQWLRMYHENLQEGLSDVYTVPGGGYILGGTTSIDNQDEGSQMWIVRVDDNGNEIWSNQYGAENISDGAGPIIEADNGDFVTAGASNGLIAALRVNSDGEQLWFRTYGRRACYAIIELKNGEFLLCGRGGAQAFILCIDGAGDLLWERNYGDGNSPRFYTLRETEDGAVAAGSMRFEGVTFVWAVKVDVENEGEPIWSHTYANDEFNECRSMVSDGAGNFLLAGKVCNGRGGDDWSNDMSLLKIDLNGDLLWWRRYNWGDEEGVEECFGLERMPDDGFVMVGRRFWDQNSNFKPAAIRVDSNGALRWQRLYNFTEDDGYAQGMYGYHWFSSVVIGHDNAILATGKLTRSDDGTGQNGLLIKLEHEILEPIVFYWSPEDTLLTVLRDDSVEFVVRARDQQGNELDYLWIMGEDTLSTDTTRTITFEELGEFQVQCQVSDGEFTTAITWHVSVLNWYIDIFQPDSTEITVRRGSSIDFTHHVRANEEFEFEYQWEHFGRGGNFQFDGEDSVRFDFDLAGDHIIRAWVMNGEENETIEWDVSVRSILWWWWPHEFELSAYEDTTIVFEVFSFDQDSDSVEYSWSLDNEVLNCDSSLIEIPFPEIGQYVVTAYAREGVEADTIRWSINVEEWSFTTDLADLTDLPTSPVLYPASPNPFNSTVRLSMYLPKADHVSLAVFDVTGREVSRLVDGDVGAGSRTFVWNASDFPAGVYVVRMEAGDAIEMRKVVLVR